MGGMREIRGFTKIWEDEHPLHILEAYYRASLEKVRRLFKSNKNISYEISKLCHFLFTNNNK